MAGGRQDSRKHSSEGDSLVIRDVAAVKALTDPFRRNLLDLLDTPRTVRELADAVDRPADRLYYHLSLLERHGLVRVHEERGAERRYQVAAQRFEIDPALTLTPATLDGLINTVLDRVQREFAAATRRRRKAGEPKRATLSFEHYRLSDEEAEELTRRLDEVLAEYPVVKPGEDDDDGRRVFGVLRALWPVEDRPR